jgi:hypothetical protein
MPNPLAMQTAAGEDLCGAAVVLDVNTGEVLAMASVPRMTLFFSGPLTADKYNNF